MIVYKIGSYILELRYSSMVEALLMVKLQVHVLKLYSLLKITLAVMALWLVVLILSSMILFVRSS